MKFLPGISRGAVAALSIAEGELVDLYNISARILHSRNPFSTADATHQIGYTVDEWLARLEACYAGIASS